MGEHEFHALYWHFGRFGPQDVHMHPCMTHENCRHALEGSGRSCVDSAGWTTGKTDEQAITTPQHAPHRQVRWLISKGWVPVGASSERGETDDG